MSTRVISEPWLAPQLSGIHQSLSTPQQERSGELGPPWAGRRGCGRYNLRRRPFPASTGHSHIHLLATSTLSNDIFLFRNANIHIALCSDFMNIISFDFHWLPQGGYRSVVDIIPIYRWRNEAEKLVRWPPETWLIQSRRKGTETQVWLQISFSNTHHAAFSLYLNCSLKNTLFFYSLNNQPLFFNLWWLDVKTFVYDWQGTWRMLFYFCVCFHC